MKMKFKIPTPDDRQDQFYSTSFLVKYIPEIPDSLFQRFKRHKNQFGEYEYVVQPGGMSSAVEPTIDILIPHVKRAFFPRNRMNKYSVFSDENQSILVSRKMQDGMFTFLLQHEEGKVSINSKRLTKANSEYIMAKLVNRMCFEKSAKTMIEYLDTLMVVSPRVLYALENRTPYSFFNEGRKINVRLNTKRISEKECALEISDSLWLPISNKDLDSFLRFHRDRNNRSKKWNLSPLNLIKVLDPTTFLEMSESTIKVMHSFLDQNRTKKIVEERAQKLLTEMGKKFPTKLTLFNYYDRKALLVNGQLSDWVIIAPERNPDRASHQLVEVYSIKNETGVEGEKENSKSSVHQYYHMSGPICIDNIHNNSSVGDQMVSRALALLNDKQAVEAIYTIRSHLPSSPLRVDKSLLSKEGIN